MIARWNSSQMRSFEVQGFGSRKARTIAQEIASQPDIAAAAEEWAVTKAFPHHPVVKGWTPAGMAAQFPDFKPSLVFTMLCELRSRPQMVEGLPRYDHRPPV